MVTVCRAGVYGKAQRHMTETIAKDVPYLSIVIPARNEEGNIGLTIGAIHNSLQGRIAYEVIVVDNDSSDSTRSVAQACNARVISSKAGTIGSSRNRGVDVAKGLLVVFLDADMILDRNFWDVVERNREELVSHRIGLLGGVFRAPDSAGWVPRTWFDSRRVSEGRSHIASGQMMVARSLFLANGGFDEALSSGEDYDLSLRMKAAGFQLRTDPAWTAVHVGGPDTVGEFFKREIWHGQKARQMTQFGKVEIATLVFVCAHILLAMGFAVGESMLVIAAIICSIAIPSFAAHRRFGHLATRSTLLFYMYFWARAIAILRRISGLAPIGRALGR